MESVKERMERIGAYEKIASFMQKEKQPYEFKRKYAQIRAEEFATECDGRGLSYHVSVGGLDSIVLYLFLHGYAELTHQESAHLHWKTRAYRECIKHLELSMCRH